MIIIVYLGKWGSGLIFIFPLPFFFLFHSFLLIGIDFHLLCAAYFVIFWEKIVYNRSISKRPKAHKTLLGLTRKNLLLGVHYLNRVVFIGDTGPKMSGLDPEKLVGPETARIYYYIFILFLNLTLSNSLSIWVFLLFLFWLWNWRNILLLPTILGVFFY